MYICSDQGKRLKFGSTWEGKIYFASLFWKINCMKDLAVQVGSVISLPYINYEATICPCSAGSTFTSNVF